MLRFYGGALGVCRMRGLPRPRSQRTAPYAGRMAAPTLTVVRTPPDSADADVLLLGVYKTDEGARLAIEDAAFSGLQSALGQIGMSGSVDEVRRLPAPGSGIPVALVGLGSASPDVDALRY